MALSYIQLILILVNGVNKKKLGLIMCKRSTYRHFTWDKNFNLIFVSLNKMSAL